MILYADELREEAAAAAAAAHFRRRERAGRNLCGGRSREIETDRRERWGDCKRCPVVSQFSCVSWKWASRFRTFASCLPEQ